MFKNIMVPTDGSEYAAKAEDVAVELAKQLNAKIVGIYVIDEKLIYPYEVLEDEGNEILQSLQKKAEDAGVEFKEELITGDPLRDMKTIARKANADLVVISPHGKNKIEKLIIGSVADRVIKTSDVPVMIVH